MTTNPTGRTPADLLRVGDRVVAVDTRLGDDAELRAGIVDHIHDFDPTGEGLAPRHIAVRFAVSDGVTFVGHFQRSEVTRTRGVDDAPCVCGAPAIPGSESCGDHDAPADVLAPTITETPDGFEVRVGMVKVGTFPTIDEARKRAGRPEAIADPPTWDFDEIIADTGDGGFAFVLR